MIEVLTDSSLPDIPRLFTAVAEWGACLVFILILPRRRGWVSTAAIALLGLGALALVQTWAGTLPIPLWIPGMLAAALMMFLLLRATLRVSAIAAGYLMARAFVLAELVASIHWQLDRFYLVDYDEAVRLSFFALIYVVALSGAWLAERRHFVRGASFTVGWRELISALAIAGATFAISNLSFVNANTPFSGRLGPEIFYIRTLVDLCGYISLYVQHELQRTTQARRDAAAMAQLVSTQHEQYEISRRAIDEVNRKYHDMKHHLDAVRAEQDPHVRGRILDDLGDSIRDYGARVRTGNPFLDAVLTAKQLQARERGIQLAVVADGRLLASLRPLDTTAIVGNALDNALEAATRLVDADSRSVNVSLYEQDGFTMLRVENTFDGVVIRNDKGIATRKTGDGHGYGLRSIEAAVERYGGSMSVSVSPPWFRLTILLPTQTASVPHEGVLSID